VIRSSRLRGSRTNVGRAILVRSMPGRTASVSIKSTSTSKSVEQRATARLDSVMGMGSVAAEWRQRRCDHGVSGTSVSELGLVPDRSLGEEIGP